MDLPTRSASNFDLVGFGHKLFSIQSSAGEPARKAESLAILIGTCEQGTLIVIFFVSKMHLGVGSKRRSHKEIRQAFRPERD